MNNKFKQFLIREGFTSAAGNPTVFVVSFGDGRMSYGSGTAEKLVGIFATHEEAMEAAMAAEKDAGLEPDRMDDHYGAMIDEIELQGINNHLRDLGVIK